MTSLVTFDIECKDRFSGKSINGTGGMVVVTLTGLYKRATLYNPDTGASLSQPVAMTRGKARFAIDTGVTGQAIPPGVDIYGISPNGIGFQLYNAKPGDPGVVRLSNSQVDCQLVAPFSYEDAVATEFDTGLDFPVGALVGPSCWAHVAALDAGMTLNIGLLSTESGGDADGLAALLSLAATGVVRPKWASTATAGALVLESQDSAAVNSPREALISTAVSLSWTNSSSSDTGTGRIICPYKRGNAQ